MVIRLGSARESISMYAQLTRAGSPYPPYAGPIVRQRSPAVRSFS